MSPKISIIIPVYNMGDNIRDSVSSVLEQSIKEYEIILVDDGSKDNSLSECEKLRKIDSRIRIFHTDNRGSGPARNYGISVAQGEYLYFMDADDSLHPDAIKVMTESIDKYNPDLLVFGFNKSMGAGLKSTKHFSNETFSGSIIRNDYSDFYDMSGKHTIQGAPWNKLFKMDLIRQFNIEYPALRRHQDDAFIGRYMCYAEKIVFISDVLYTHYLNDLTTEWRKYPVNYIESVLGLYECRKETVLLWNPQDVRTRGIIDSEYVCNSIKAFEMFFSPKIQLGHSERKERIIEAINEAHIQEITSPLKIGHYQDMVLSLIKNKKYNGAIMLMKVKVFLEKVGIVYRIKKLLRH